MTSSAGRLFDAVAGVLGLCDTASYEGQAAVRLQGLAESAGSPCGVYPVPVQEDAEGALVLDTGALFRAVVEDLLRGHEPKIIARRFHESLAVALARTCRRLRAETGIGRVVLSGGVFQNLLLLKLVEQELGSGGFEVLSHRLVPPNDAGVALGQAAVALARLA